MNRGCCCCALETCVKLQGYVVVAACAANMVRLLCKAMLEPGPEQPSGVAKYLDGADWVVNGLGGLMLLTSALLLLRGLRKRRPSLLQPYLVVAGVQATALGLYAVLCGVAAIQALPEPRPDFYPDRALLSAGEIGAIVVAVLLLLLAFSTYFLLNVSSLYHYMSSDQYRQQHFYYIGT